MIQFSGFIWHRIHIPRLGKKIRFGLVPVSLLVKTSMVKIIILLTTHAMVMCGAEETRQIEHIYCLFRKPNL